MESEVLSPRVTSSPRWPLAPRLSMLQRVTHLCEARRQEGPQDLLQSHGQYPLNIWTHRPSSTPAGSKGRGSL